MTAEIQDLEVVETRKLASFRIVDSIEPIPGADAIELAVVGGWKVVTKKGEFQPGDPCVYFEIDSFMPDGVPAWQFLVDKSPRMQSGICGHRLRTIKLRGQISQGLILKISEFPVLEQILNPTLTLARDIEDPAYNCWFGLHEYEAALSPQDLILNDVLNIVKWDPPLPAQLQGLAEGLFPSWIRKTDQERAQNLKDEIFGYEDTVIPANDELGRPEIIRRAKAQRFARYEITMKMDGSSATFFHRDGEVGVCSRNLQLKVCDGNKDNSFVRMLFDSGLNWALEAYGNIAVQGELMGPAIQGNRENLKDFTLYIFDVQLIDEHRNMTSVERLAFVKELISRGVNPNKVKHAPVLTRAADGGLTWISNIPDLPEVSWFTLEELGLTSMDALLSFAEGPSLVHAIREGLVYKREDGSFSMKTISNAYLAKEKD
jgi:hypothetical protein